MRNERRGGGVPLWAVVAACGTCLIVGVMLAVTGYVFWSRLTKPPVAATAPTVQPPRTEPTPAAPPIKVTVTVPAEVPKPPPEPVTWEAVLKRANAVADALIAAEPAKTKAHIVEMERRPSTEAAADAYLQWGASGGGDGHEPPRGLGSATHSRLRAGGFTDYSAATALKWGRKMTAATAALKLRFEESQRKMSAPVDSEATALVYCWMAAGELRDDGAILAAALTEYYGGKRPAWLDPNDETGMVFDRIIRLKSN